MWSGPSQGRRDRRIHRITALICSLGNPAAGIQTTTTEHGLGFHQRQDLVWLIRLYIIAGSPKNNYFSRNTNPNLQRVAHSLVVTREKSPSGIKPIKLIVFECTVFSAAIFQLITAVQTLSLNLIEYGILYCSYWSASNSHLFYLMSKEAP